eukprot:3646220-Heterocapsa_arctica.AAC.1
MHERNSNTDRGTRFGLFQRTNGEKKYKQKGKRSHTLNQYCGSENYIEHSMVRYVRGSSGS